eukprot:3358893-Amphidinium_carterae.1
MDISAHVPPVSETAEAMERVPDEIVPRRILEDRVAEGERQLRARRPIREMSQLLRQHRRERAVATGEEEQEPQRRRARLIRRKKVRPPETQQPLEEERRVRPRIEAYEPDLWESADGVHQRIHTDSTGCPG